MTPKRKKFLERCRKRREKIRKLKESGRTYAEIATRFGVSRQRIYMILNPKKK